MDGQLTEEQNLTPCHVAIIMDGNGRWAKAQGKVRSEGHLAGAHNLETVMKAAVESGVKYLTVYAFSTENWKRPESEVSYLMKLIPEFCRMELEALKGNGVRLRVIGRRQQLPLAARMALDMAESVTAKNDRLTLTLAINYGGRAELVDAVNALINDKKRKGDVTEEDISRHLYAPDIPDPDLLIRTGGEFRLSNFLLWELSYAEFYVTDTYWPDFGREEFRKALDAFGKRNRRFGDAK